MVLFKIIYKFSINIYIFCTFVCNDFIVFIVFIVIVFIVTFILYIHKRSTYILDRVVKGNIRNF